MEDPLLDECEDELWEAQTNRGGMWLPAPDRGVYCDRLGRFKFASLGDVPNVDSSWLTTLDWTCESSPWLYGKSWAKLGAVVANGKIDKALVEPNITTSQRASKTHCVRWRRWYRKRGRHAPSAILASGWLGEKMRRGTWKSRHFTLISSSGGDQQTITWINTTPEQADESDSSEDGVDVPGEDPPTDDDGPLLASPKLSRALEPPVSAISLLGGGGNDSLQSSGKANSNARITLPGGSILAAINAGGATNNTITQQPPPPTLSEQEPPTTTCKLVYFRKGFDKDPRSILSRCLEPHEITKMPKKYLHTLALPSKCRVDGAIPDAPAGYFSIKFPNGSRRYLNASTVEEKHRWVEVLSSVFDDPNSSGDGKTSPQRRSLMRAVASRAKRGQTELGKVLMGRRSSTSSDPSKPIPSGTTPTQQSFSSSRTASSSTRFFMSSSSGGGGATISANIPASSSSTSPSIPQLPRKIVEVLKTDHGLGIRLIEKSHPSCGVFIGHVADWARDANDPLNIPYGIKINDRVVSICGETLSTTNPGEALNRAKEITTKLAKGQRAVIELESNSSPLYKPTFPDDGNNNTLAGFVSTGLDPTEWISASTVSDTSPTHTTRTRQTRRVSSTETESERPLTESLGYGEHHGLGGSNSSVASVLSPLIVPQPTEVPSNEFGITTLLTRQVTLECLEKRLLATSSGGSDVSFFNIRSDVAEALHIATNVVETEAWVVWFRIFLDSICDGARYKVGGLEPVTFSPTISLVNSPPSAGSGQR